MSASVYRLAEFDAESMSMSAPQKSSMGGTIIWVNHRDVPGPWYLQTPLMRAPFGISVFTDEKTGKQNMKLALSFDGSETDEQIAAARDSLIRMDDMMMRTAVENSEQWFGKKCSRETIEHMYIPIVKKSTKLRDDGRPFEPTFQVKVPLDGSNNPVKDFELFEFSGARHDPSEIADLVRKNTQLQLIFQFQMVYFIGKQAWGLSAKAHAVRFKPSAAPVQGFAMFGDADDAVVTGAEDDGDDVEYVATV